MQNRMVRERFFSLTEGQTLLVILALAAILRFINANSEFWFDEIVIVQRHVQWPIRDIIQRYDIVGHHVMTALLAHICAGIWGLQPWAVRLPAILFGIAGVWAFYFLARQLWTREITLLGTLLFAVSYHHVYYSQNARGYSALVFFALLATGMLLRLLRTDAERQTRWYGLAYACAIGLGMYALLVMLFIIMGHACVLLVTRRWHALGWLIAGSVFALLLYAPMAHDFIAYHRNPPETSSLLFSAVFFRELKLIIPLLVIGATITPLLLGRLARRHPLAAALIVLPLVWNIVLPAVKGQEVHPRSFIYGLPVAYFFLMEGMDWAQQRFRGIQWIGVGLVTVVSLVMLARYYPLPKQGFQQALAYIGAHRGETDNKIGLTLGGKAARFYDPSLVLIEDAEQLHQWLQGATNPTWILYTFENEMRRSSPELYSWLQTDTIHQATFPGVIGDGEVHVFLWRPHPEERTETNPR